MKPNHRRNGLLFCLLIFGLQACSLSSVPQDEPFDVVERTKPASAPWKYTATPNLSLTATSQYLATETQQALEAQVTLKAQATVTAEAFGVQSTITAAARESLISDYDYFESFDQNTYDWRVGDEDNPFWQGSTSIVDGCYTWQVASVKKAFITWSDFNPVTDLQDFEAALRIRRRLGEAHKFCYGFLFRQSPDGFDAGAYILSVCDNGYYRVLYYDAESGWDVLQDWTSTEALRMDDWNLLEISARGENFTIWINQQQMHTFRDDRLASGKVSILIDVYGEAPGQIECDFFALQPQ